MEIKRLAPGEMAPEDSDCLKIERSPDGGYTLISSALVQCDAEDPSSEAVISSDKYDSYEAAEQAGLAWAEAVCVEQLYIETDQAAPR